MENIDPVQQADTQPQAGGVRACGCAGGRRSQHSAVVSQQHVHLTHRLTDDSSTDHSQSRGPTPKARKLSRAAWRLRVATMAPRGRPGPGVRASRKHAGIQVMADGSDLTSLYLSCCDGERTGGPGPWLGIFATANIRTWVGRCC